MNIEIMKALERLKLVSDITEYAKLEEETRDILYPVDEELPLVADRRVMGVRRLERNTILVEALENRRRLS